MHELLDKVGGQLLEHGLVGALALSACWIAWTLYKENGALRQQMLEREIARVGAYHDLARDLEQTIAASLDVLEHERGGRRKLRRTHHEE